MFDFIVWNVKTNEVFKLTLDDVPQQNDEILINGITYLVVARRFRADEELDIIDLKIMTSPGSWGPIDGFKGHDSDD